MKPVGYTHVCLRQQEEVIWHEQDWEQAAKAKQRVRKWRLFVLHLVFDGRM